MAKTLSGTRIRQRRRRLGLKQSDLARDANISPSYLNLIEHNKRAASGRVLSALAMALDVPVNDLSEGAENSLVTELRSAAMEHLTDFPETERLEEFVARFPGWARLAAAKTRQMRDQDAIISALNDRYNFDPRLQGSLHEMLTNVTAIRSTSSILIGGEDIPPDQVARFQSNVHAQSVRLSEAISGLVSYFDKADQQPRDAATPQEAFELFLEDNDHAFPALDKAPDDDVIENLISGSPRLTSPEAIKRARTRLQIYAADARRLPLEEFATKARALNFSPSELARFFDADLDRIFRRLSTLRRDGINAPAFGLVIINAAGQPMYRRTLRDFSLPRFAAICAFWPVFTALSTPGQPIEEIIVLPNGREFLARAFARSLTDAAFGERPVFASAMLVTGLEDAYSYGLRRSGQAENPMKVGTSCRLCDEAACVARSEPSITASA